MPPLVPVTASVYVPDPVIGDAVPLIDRMFPAPAENVKPTLVTVPPPPDVAIQLVTPVPSVDNTYPLLPGDVGRVNDHALVAEALDLIVVA